MAKSERDVNPGEDAEAEEFGDYANDPRIVYARLSLSIIGCRPELSKFTDAELDGMGVKHQNRCVQQCRIYGKIFDLTEPKLYKPKDGASVTVDTKKSEFTFGLIGVHEAVNLGTGEFFKGGILYLPEGFHDMHKADIEKMLAERRTAANPHDVEVTYAWQFESYPSKAIAGYSWRAIPLMPLRRDDPLASLRRHALKDLKLTTPLLGQSDSAAGPDSSGPIIEGQVAGG